MNNSIHFLNVKEKKQRINETVAVNSWFKYTSVAVFKVIYGKDLLSLDASSPQLLISLS